MSDIHALSGAYAMDAVDDLERARFEQHLAICAECQAEVASLREATGVLSETTLAEPPAELRVRVLAEIATVRPLPPLSTPVAAPDEARRRPGRFRLVALAAAAAVLAAVGVGVVTQPWADDTSQAPPSAAELVLTASDAKSTSLDFDGGAKATVTHSDSVGEAVIVTEKMPPPPKGMVYQLWLDQPGTGMVSAGVMPIEADQTVMLEGDAATAKAAGITIEPAGGSPHPTTDPIALFDFGASA
jgi:anti-sigma-K factor RskA